MSTLPRYPHPHQSGTFVPVSESILAHHSHPKSIIYLEVHSWRSASCVDIWTSVQWHVSTLSTCCREGVLSSTYSFLLPADWGQPLIFSLLHNFAYFEMPYSWTSVSFWWSWKLMPRDVCDIVKNLSLRTPRPTLPLWTTACALPQLWWPQTRVE